MVNGNGSQRCQRRDGPVITASRTADMDGNLVPSTVARDAPE